MPYYMNVFPEEFQTELLMDPRLKFKLKGNPNRPEIMVAWNPEPYDLSVANLFTISYSFDGGRCWGGTMVTLTAGSSRTALQVANDLNSDAAFAGVFTAYSEGGGNNRNVLKIKRSGRVFDQFRAYVPNTASASFPNASAEQVLQFNGRCDVKVLPSMFDSYTVAFKRNNPDSLYDARMVLVDPALESYVLTSRGLPLGSAADYELLEGLSDLFTFKKVVTDTGNGNRLLEEIEYSAGSVVGGLARRTIYCYNNGNTTINANRVYQLPWLLRAVDIVAPPPELAMTGGVSLGGAAAVSHS